MTLAPPPARRLAAARLLVASRLSGSRFAGLPPALRPVDEEEAYAVQRCAHELLERAGLGPRAGWKIGCTTPVMQAYLGLESPVAGAVFAANVHRGEGRFEPGEGRRLGVECELAVRLARELPCDGPSPPGEAAVAGAVGACMAAIEVVEDRYVDYATLGTPTLVADDFFHFGCVIGGEEERFDPRRLGSASASMWIAGEPAGSGEGVDIMGDPLAALAWLAWRCARSGSPLRAGDLVLLGSLVQTRWVAPGDEVRVRNDPFGEITASFLAAAAPR